MTGRAHSSSRAVALRAALASDMPTIRAAALDTVRAALQSSATLTDAARALRVSVRTLQRLVRDFPELLDDHEQETCT